MGTPTSQRYAAESSKLGRLFQEPCLGSRHQSLGTCFRVSNASRVLTESRMMVGSSYISALPHFTTTLPIASALRPAILSMGNTYHLRRASLVLLTREVPSTRQDFEMRMEPDTSYTRSMPTQGGTAEYVTMGLSQLFLRPSLFSKLKTTV